MRVRNMRVSDFDVWYTGNTRQMLRASLPPDATLKAIHHAEVRECELAIWKAVRPFGTATTLQALALVFAQVLHRINEHIVHEAKKMKRRSTR